MADTFLEAVRGTGKRTCTAARRAPRRPTASLSAVLAFVLAHARCLLLLSLTLLTKDLSFGFINHLYIVCFVFYFASFCFILIISLICIYFVLVFSPYLLVLKAYFLYFPTFLLFYNIYI